MNTKKSAFVQVLASVMPLKMLIYSFVIYVIDPDAEGIDLAMLAYFLCFTLGVPAYLAFKVLKAIV